MARLQTTRIVGREPHRDQIEAAYMILSNMKLGTEGRDKEAVAEIWRTMFDAVPVTKRGGLTAPQRQVLEVIADFIAENGVSPTYQEIGDHFGRHRKWAHEICCQLANRKIVSLGGGWRALKILKNPSEV